MTETFIAHVNGSHRCYATSTGIDRAFIGCSHDKPREAITHTVERKGDSFDARDIRDHLRLEVDLTQHADTVPVSRSEPDRSTPQAGDEEGGPTPNEAPGHPADGPRRPAPTGVTPQAPVGAPDLGLVP